MTIKSIRPLGAHITAPLAPPRYIHGHEVDEPGPITTADAINEANRRAWSDQSLSGPNAFQTAVAIQQSIRLQADRDHKARRIKQASAGGRAERRSAKERKRKAAQMFAVGKSNKQVAGKLRVSQQYVGRLRKAWVRRGKVF